jgi:hypothetical protein
MSRAGEAHDAGMRIPDPSSGSAVAVLTQLCNQSSALRGIVLRLQNATAELTPSGGDGWHGPAESAQAALVAQLHATALSSTTAIESARRLTDAAIWSLSSAG